MSSGFVSETDLAEARKKRQEEWEKVRTPDQPLELTEEPYDSRSLYDRLKEQKMKKELEYEEAHKLKNLIRGLDDDEVEFLDLVDRTKLKAEKQQMIEEQNELKDFRKRVANLQEQSLERKIQTEKSTIKTNITTNTNRPSLKSILSGVVVRKRNLNETESSPPEKKERSEEIRKQSVETKNLNDIKQTSADELSTNCKIVENDTKTLAGVKVVDPSAPNLDSGAMRCVSILPGIGPYRESSDSEMSSGSEEEFDNFGKYDLVGRASMKTLKTKCESAE